MRKQPQRKTAQAVRVTPTVAASAPAPAYREFAAAEQAKQPFMRETINRINAAVDYANQTANRMDRFLDRFKQQPVDVATAALDALPSGSITVLVNNALDRLFEVLDRMDQTAKSTDELA